MENGSGLQNGYKYFFSLLSLTSLKKEKNKDFKMNKSIDCITRKNGKMSPGKYTFEQFLKDSRLMGIILCRNRIRSYRTRCLQVTIRMLWADSTYKKSCREFLITFKDYSLGRTSRTDNTPFLQSGCWK